MENESTVIAKEFLYLDENVKYSFTANNSHLTIHCNHPVFINRYKSNSIALPVNDFAKNVQKGSLDYDFFEKLKISLDEYFLDHGTEE